MASRTLRVEIHGRTKPQPRLARLITRALRPFVAPLIREAIIAERARVLEEDLRREQAKVEQVAKTESSVLVSSLIDIINGGIGGKVGLGSDGPPGNAGGIAKF
jgi:hypothetical protein